MLFFYRKLQSTARSENLAPDETDVGQVLPKDTVTDYIIVLSHYSPHKSEHALSGC